MRPQDRSFDEFDDYEDFDDEYGFSAERSLAFNRLLDEHRREERRRKANHRSYDQARRLKREDWDWDDDLDSYVDDLASRYQDTRNGFY